VPIVRLLDDHVFHRTGIMVELWDPERPLPPHDVVFNGVGDADSCEPALALVEQLLRGSKARIVNPPARVRATGRASNAERLRTIPGATMAQTELWRRETLLSPDAPRALAEAGFRWPLLVRPPGAHGGEHFEWIERPEDLRRTVLSVPGEELFVIAFVDVRGEDGKFRKYRVLMIGGQLYPLHLAVSHHWKVHYFSADMANSAAHREEDRAFLEDMPRVLGREALGKLEQIRDRIGLDYGGIDFAINSQGDVVVFETNATMNIVPPAHDDIWTYRRAPVARAERAVRALLLGASPEEVGGSPEKAAST
jgi:hypothetical protein